MHRCHHPALLSITSVIVPSSLNCAGSRKRARAHEKERDHEVERDFMYSLKSFGLFTVGSLAAIFEEAA